MPSEEPSFTEQQKLILRRLELLKTRVLSGDVRGLVYIAESSDGRIYEGMVGRLTVSKVSMSMQDLRLDLADRHARGLKTAD